MWVIPLTLVVVSSCVALPAPQQGGENLDSLISSVFGSPTENTVPTTATTATVPSANKDNLDDLISNVFGNPQQTTTPTTYLGTQNKPKPQPENCECVPYYQCRNGTITDNGIDRPD